MTGMEQSTLKEGESAATQPPANDLPSVIEAMLSVQQPTDASPEFLSGWKAAVDAVTAAAADYVPAYTYQLYVDVHTGWVGVSEANAQLMRGRGHRVQRRLSGPWEPLPRHGDL